VTVVASSSTLDVSVTVTWRSSGQWCCALHARQMSESRSLEAVSRPAAKGKLLPGLKLPRSSMNLLICKRRDHVQIPGAVECYGTACSVSTLEGSLSYERVYLSCGK
jgi:hypothetical protein